MLLHYSGLELPVFDEGALIPPSQLEVTTPTIRDDSFVRYVRTSGPEESLKSQLNRADGFFKRIAKLCGIKIVPYKWGLCPSVDTVTSIHRGIAEDVRYRDPVIPAGFLLGAEVARITPHYRGDMPAYAIDLFLDGEERFLEELAHLGDTHAYDDFGPHQTMFGSQTWDDNKPQTGIWYVDIEPLAGKSLEHIHAVERASA